MLSVRASGKHLTLTLCFPSDNRFSPIPANIESPTVRHVPSGKGWSDKSSLLFVKAMCLSWNCLRTPVNCSSHNHTFLNGGMPLFNSGFLALDSVTLYPLVTAVSLVRWSLVMVCSDWLGDWSSKCWQHRFKCSNSTSSSSWTISFPESISSVLSSKIGSLPYSLFGRDTLYVLDVIFF